MTEDEKRKLAMEIFAQQQSTSRSEVALSNARAQVEASLRQSARRQATFQALAQKGITWEQLRDAYEEEFNRGHEAMIDHHLAYFYAGIALAFKEERTEATPEEVAEFVKAVYSIPDEIADRKSMIQTCKEQVGIDISIYDEDITHASSRATMNATSRSTRKDREAISRMRKTGITPQDLEYERDLGYKNGWKSGFNFSVCYRAAALILHRSYDFDVEDIERFIERLEELR